MDEPFAALDEITRQKLNNDLLELWQRQEFTVIFVTHSVFELVYLSERIVVMAARPGRVIADLEIEAPYPRDDAFRTSPVYNGFCRQVVRHSGRGDRRMSTTTVSAAPAAAFRTTGTDAEAVVALPRERRVLGLPVSIWPKILAPLAIGVVILALWEIAVRTNDVPAYILPGPLLIIETLFKDWGTLSVSLWVTVQITALALAVAVALGVSISVLFSQSKWIELSFFPYAVILQVTPIVAIAPLIIIWVDDIRIALLICAWIVAFFPILSNTTLGLNSADHNLINLFQLYGASRWQTLRHLRLPAAMPYFLGGLRISGGLALIGAIVAEFVAGTGGRASGLAYRILESGYQLQIPRMFAALLLISMTGIAIFLCLSLISHLCLRKWHESAIRREN